ncbi:hypothetical protein QPM17_20490 [Marinobacter sp. TBZ242]|uniref:Uncharacterized protein n=1 Tax=Marinobacter azerbaijanicus TaxID=3050455 RepID=A0ABT7III8_9GAMM|nr:hypothetical protein [Marinobacter sp. TBZ242]MDL0433527.1 hypothetical protein [Marinobacter sp. TBZ242]
MPLLIDEVIAEVEESPTTTTETSSMHPDSGTYQAPLFEQLEKLRERQQRLEVD